METAREERRKEYNDLGSIQVMKSKGKELERKNKRRSKKKGRK